MAEKDDPLPTNDIKVRKHHRQGYKHIINALELEEKEGLILPDFKYAVRLYSQGINEFKRGININLKETGKEDDSARRLQEKMINNLKMAESRVVELTVKIETLEQEIKVSTAKEKENKVPASSSSSSSVKKRPTESGWNGVKKGDIRKPSESLSSTKKPTAAKFTETKRSSLTNRTTSTKKAPATTSAQTGESKRDELKKKISKLNGINETHAHMILDEVLQRDKGVSFEDIGGMETAKRILDEIVILPASRPELFKGLRAPARGLLLFGPPGNGKTLLAKALSTEAKAVFFNISAASLTSKFIGEGEKLMRTLFAMARLLQPAIIFIDEIDSLLSKRKENEHEASRRLKTEFLVAFDGVISEGDERILVLGATNRPWELDDAALRRMVKKVYVPLPDYETRKDIIKKNMNKQDNVCISEKEYDHLARITDGYSGSDLTALSKEAALMAIRAYTSEELKTIPADQVRGINASDFKSAMDAIRKSVSVDHLGEFERWNETYGTR